MPPTPLSNGPVQITQSAHEALSTVMPPENARVADSTSDVNTRHEEKSPVLRGYLPSHSSIPRGFLCMLGLVSCIELFVALNGRHFKTDIATSWSATSHDAIHEAKECEVLCFGDSLVKFGVLPRVVEAWSGRRTFNLALLNGPPSASYYLLRRALWAGARPKAVVIDIMPHQLARGPRHEEFARAWPELLSIPDCLDLAWATRDPDLLASTIMATLFPSIRARREIRACIHAAMVGRSASFKDQARALRANWTAHRGGQVASRGPQAMPSFEWPDDAPLSRPWASDRVSVGFLNWPGRVVSPWSGSCRRSRARPPSDVSCSTRVTRDSSP